MALRNSLGRRCKSRAKADKRFAFASEVARAAPLAAFADTKRSSYHQGLILARPLVRAAPVYVACALHWRWRCAMGVAKLRVGGRCPGEAPCNKRAVGLRVRVGERPIPAAQHPAHKRVQTRIPEHRGPRFVVSGGPGLVRSNSLCPRAITKLLEHKVRAGHLTNNQDVGVAVEVKVRRM